jgi:hypothetical protein
MTPSGALMSLRAVVAFALALLVGGCATPQNTLTQDKRDALRIDAIELSFAPDAQILWLDATSRAPEDPAAKRAYLEQKAAGPIKAALDAEIKRRFAAPIRQSSGCGSGSSTSMPRRSESSSARRLSPSGPISN